MIVRCPECQTGFNLSPEKVPAKGAKLRCSQCDHLFRVRITDGRSEIFYKNKAENIPLVNPNNETQMGGLHRNLPEPKRETAQLNTMESGDQTSFGYPSRTGTQPRQKGMVPLIRPKVSALPLRAPILTPPAIDLRKDAEKPPQRIKSPSKRKLTPVPSEGLDLFGDDSGFNFSNNDRSVEDPFFGAFDEPDENILFSPKTDALDISDLSEVSKSDFPQERTSWAEDAPPEESIKVEMSPEDFFSRGGSARNYDELVPKPPKSPPLPDSTQKRSSADINAAVEPEEIEAPKPAAVKEQTKKSEPRLELAIQRNPIKPTRAPTANSNSRPSKKGKKRKASQPIISQSPIALKPHKIGGNTFRRIFDTLFIGIFLLGSYVGVIAYKTGGFFDFSAPLHMLEVAFEGKPYEMSRQLEVKTEKQKGINNLMSPYVNNLIAIPHRLKSKDYVLLVNGLINNPDLDEKSNQEVLVEISSNTGKKEQAVHIGESLSLAQLKARLEADTFSTLLMKNSLPKTSSTPFFVVFRSPVRFRNLEIKTKIISK